MKPYPGQLPIVLRSVCSALHEVTWEFTTAFVRKCPTLDLWFSLYRFT
ncbi:MAG TPA: hypothetical protein PKA58_04955 [Polyangium sp.]|nr:hypothetical protein [Polyangium sp.]